MKNLIGAIFLLFFSIIFFQSNCFSQNHELVNDDVLGFDFMDKITGLWNGPVYSNTPAGSFDVWYVDFRPNAESQVSQYSSLDAHTINYTSFFIVDYQDEMKIAMRTEGVFMNKGCVTYEVLDSVNVQKGYYRFSDFQAGENRAFTEFIFKDDKLIMQTFTNKFNTEEKLTLHSKWEAKLASKTYANQAKEQHNFPQAIAVKDFTDAFKNMTESIYFTFENDPYPTSPQPNVGSVTVNIKIDESIKVKDHHELFIALFTENIFDGLKYKKENLKYFSKHVYLPVDTKSFTIENVHPGKYYLFSYNDVNEDKKHKKGDYMSSNLNHVIDVPVNGNVEVETVIDFLIP